jgi:hypothetical protein
MANKFGGGIGPGAFGALGGGERIALASEGNEQHDFIGGGGGARLCFESPPPSNNLEE